MGWRQGGIVYFTRTAQGEEHDRLYRLDEATGDEYLVLDPNHLTAQGEAFALGLVEPSPDGATVAFCVDRTGAERFELRFRDVDAGQELTDRIPEVSYGGAWSTDGRSFFYTVADPSGRTFAVRRHDLGSEAGDDPTVHEETDRRYEVELRGTRDGRWVVITAASRDTCEVYLVPADDPSAAPRSVALGATASTMPSITCPAAGTAQGRTSC